MIDLRNVCIDYPWKVLSANAAEDHPPKSKFVRCHGNVSLWLGFSSVCFRWPALRLSSAAVGPAARSLVILRLIGVFLLSLSIFLFLPELLFVLHVKTPIISLLLLPITLFFFQFLSSFKSITMHKGSIAELTTLSVILHPSCQPVLSFHKIPSLLSHPFPFSPFLSHSMEPSHPRPSFTHHDFSFLLPRHTELVAPLQLLILRPCLLPSPPSRSPSLTP